MKFSLNKSFVPIVLLLSLGGVKEVSAYIVTKERAQFIANVICPVTDKDGDTTFRDHRLEIIEAIKDKEIDSIQWGDFLDDETEQDNILGFIGVIRESMTEKIGEAKLGKASADSGLGKGAIFLGVGFLISYLAQNRDRVAELARLADEDPKAFAEFVWGEAKGLVGLSKDVVMVFLDLGVSDLKPSTYTSFKENPVGNSIKILLSTVSLVGGGYAAYQGSKKVKHRHDDEGKSWPQAMGITDNPLIREEGALLYNTK